MSSEPRRVENQLTDKGYVPVYTTAVIDQPWDRYCAKARFRMIPFLY